MKKITVLGCMIVLLVSLAGCGKQAPEDEIVSIAVRTTETLNTMAEEIKGADNADAILAIVQKHTKTIERLAKQAAELIESLDQDAIQALGSNAEFLDNMANARKEYEEAEENVTFSIVGLPEDVMATVMDSPDFDEAGEKMGDALEVIEQLLRGN